MAVILDIVIGLGLGIAITGTIAWLLPFHGSEPRVRLPRAEMRRRKRLGLDITPALQRDQIVHTKR